jgi:hypothetical protein
MAGLYLNSYGLTLDGDVRLFRMADAGSSYRRHELRDLAGVSVWLDHNDAFAYERPAADAPATEVVTRPLTPRTTVSLWAAREAVIAHCGEHGYEARFGHGGELQIAGLIESADEGKFRIEHVIWIRIADEEYVDASAVLTARHRARWSYRGSLADREAQAWASGRRALRLNGDGPATGRIAAVDGDRLILLAGGDELALAASHYTMTIDSRLVAAWGGSGALRRMRTTTGDLTVTGKRNKHAVEDRFKLVGDAMRRLGTTITVIGGGQLIISDRPLGIRLEDAP